MHCDHTARDFISISNYQGKKWIGNLMSNNPDSGENESLEPPAR